MHWRQRSDPGLHASCFLEKSVKGRCLWHEVHRTIEPLSDSTHAAHRSMPARRRSWFTPKEEVGFSWQQATHRTNPSPAAGAMRVGAATVRKPAPWAAADCIACTHTWQCCIPDLFNGFGANSIKGFFWPHDAQVQDVGPPPWKMRTFDQGRKI